MAAVDISVPTLAHDILYGGNYYKIQLVLSTGEPAPLPHIEDSKKLEAQGYYELFDIILANGSKLYFKNNKTVSWQGNSYEGTGIKIEGIGSYADDQRSRPKLTLWNPAGVFSSLVDQGHLENATVIRYRVLKEHVDSDLPIYRRQQWKVKRIASVKIPWIGLELRDLVDGQTFLTPGRMFIPPEFSAVSLS